MINGVLLLHKERGMTSHDCVFKVRKILHTKKSAIQAPRPRGFRCSPYLYRKSNEDCRILNR